MIERAGIVLQARMGSSRLPGKVLADLGGRSLLARVLDRLRLVRGVAVIVVAVPDTPENDVLADAAQRLCAEVFRGPEDDVLERIRGAAAAYGLSRVMRATCDNPLVCFTLATDVLAMHEAEGLDYASNRNESGSGIPDGAGVEVYSMETLERIGREARLPEDREHVNEYVFRNPGLFATRIMSVPREVRMPGLRVTVDTPEDLERMRAIYAEFSWHAGPVPLTLVVARAREGAPWA
ncbi:spore coat polysaccharide biosynthesis protein SpsF [Desulfobaculum xiamenense]|uniref:Spore coat polysaccharide biosynthesis protein SpsF n=1 Tax=Desulfobaculum xiamenense TaxID=995050 RepID=A0A846QQE0_9BACT|nr:NTP transferase domain-containing protein [Desulfobaculum xiamenense]NJB69200.1 spore coat polysaccharide biosynthesis protein SpsF [Desulfobaculum xiamenense]